MLSDTMVQEAPSGKCGAPVPGTSLGSFHIRTFALSVLRPFS